MTKNIIFNLPAEAMQGASEAIILGDFNSWNPENAPKLKKQGDGSFNTVVPLETGKTYRYRFLLDNTRWVNDYNAQGYEAVPGFYVDNCVINIPQENKSEVLVAPAKDTKRVAAKTPKKAKPVKTEVTKNVKAKAADRKATKSEKSVKGR